VQWIASGIGWRRYFASYCPETLDEPVSGSIDCRFDGLGDGLGFIGHRSRSPWAPAAAVAVWRSIVLVIEHSFYRVVNIAARFAVDKRRRLATGWLSRVGG
jgi:hypothetical protein